GLALSEARLDLPAGSQLVADLVLAPSRLKRRPYGAQKRRDVQRTLEQIEVRGTCDSTSALLLSPVDARWRCKHNQWEVRPSGLRIENVRQGLKRARLKYVVGEHGGGSAPLDFPTQEV